VVASTSNRKSALTSTLLLQLPVILSGTNLVAPSLNWSLTYLEENMGGAKHTVYLSKSREFLYFDEKKVSLLTPVRTHSGGKCIV